MKKLLLLLLLCTTTISHAQIINFPDANFKAKLLSGSNIDDNDDGEIDVTEALDVTRLNLRFANISDLTGIEFFTNVIDLNCDNNNLTTLDLTVLPNLEDVNAYENNLTSVTIAGLANLEYCNIRDNQLTNIDVTGLPSLRALIVSNNQLTTLDVQSFTPLVSRIECEGNLLTSLDVSHLTALTLFKCGNNLLESLNIKNGSIERFGWGFGGNPTLRYICADNEQFFDVEDKIIEYGYTNCYLNSLCSYVSGQNFHAITGDVLFDEGSDGCNINDAIYPNLELTLSDGSNTATAFSDAAGNYNFDIQDGTYTVTPVELNTTYFSFSPASVTVNFPTDPAPSFQDFCVTPNGVYNDLEVEFRSAGVGVYTNTSYPITNDFPIALSDNLLYSFRIFYKNKGTTTQSGRLAYGLDTSQITMITTTPVPTSQNNVVLTWDFVDLKPFETREILIVLEFTGQGMSTFFHTASVTPDDTDFTPQDNTFSLTHDVFCCLLDTPEFSFNDYFTIYPNPTREVLNVKLKKSISVSSFTIYNMFGQKVKTIPYKNTDLTSIDVTDLKSGQYFVRIATDKTLFTKRFIKK